MDFEVSGPGEVPNLTCSAQWVLWESRLPREMNHDFDAGCWLMQERLRHREEQEFDFSLEFSYSIGDEICDRIFGSNQLRNAFDQVWNVRPFPKKKTGEAVPGPFTLHSTLPGRDAEANWLQRSGKVFWRLQNRPV